MFTGSEIDNSGASIPSAAPRRAWITVGWYLIAALGPIPEHFWLRMASSLPASGWRNVTAFDSYFGPSLIYHGAAALCAWRLIGRRADAVRPALVVVLWVALALLKYTWLWAQGSQLQEAALWITWLALLLASLLALHVMRLRARGRLPE